MRLIDADVLKEDLTRFYDGEVTARQLIDAQPTVQPAPPEPCEDVISRQAAINAAIDAADDWDGGYSLSRADMIERAINNLPPAQPEVIRCKDCRYCDIGIDEDGNPFLKCLGWVYGGTQEEDFCSHAERRTDA